MAQLAVWWSASSKQDREKLPEPLLFCICRQFYEWARRRRSHTLIAIVYGGFVLGALSRPSDSNPNPNPNPCPMAVITAINGMVCLEYMLR